MGSLRSQGEPGRHVPEPHVTAIPVRRAAGELVGIQYLRGLAAVMVVIYHVAAQLSKMGYQGGWVGGLAAGVDLFFVISGLIMWVTTAGRDVSPTTFWWRRIVRVVPLYWLVTAFMLAIAMAAPQLVSAPAADLAYVAKSFLFVPAINPLTGVIQPLVPLGWTLNYEMFFYLVFGLFLLLPGRWRMMGTIGVLGLIVAAGVLGGMDRHTPAGFYTSAIVMEFAYGMLLGALLKRGGVLDELPAAAGWLIGLAGLAALVLVPESPNNLVERMGVRGLSAVCVVAGILIVEARGRLPRIALLKWIGDASYSIYLSQLITFAAATVVWRKLHLDTLPGGWVGYSLFSVAACIVVGIACHVLVERPLAKSLRHSPRTGAALVETA